MYLPLMSLLFLFLPFNDKTPNLCFYRIISPFVPCEEILGKPLTWVQFLSNLGRAVSLLQGLDRHMPRSNLTPLQEISGEQMPYREARVPYCSPYVKWCQVSICLRGKHSQSCHLGAYGHCDRRKCPLTCQVLNASCQNYILLMTSCNLWRKVKRHLFPQATGRTTQLHSTSCNNYIQAKCLALQY